MGHRWDSWLACRRPGWEVRPTLGELQSGMPSRRPGLPLRIIGTPSVQSPAPQPEALASRPRPLTAALMDALLLTRDELMQRALDDNLPSLVVAAEAVVRRAVVGDLAAAMVIADRIEGRVGLRPDEVAPDDPARRQRVQAAIESVVRFMAERAASGRIMGAGAETGAPGLPGQEAPSSGPSG
jgi:hypothetical protein